MELNTLTAISPIDGRYRKQTEKLDEYFSEYALIKYRFKVEVKYLAALTCILPQLSHFGEAVHRFMDMDFTLEEAQSVKRIEKTTNHDVKSVEVFIRELMLDYPKEREFIHFALTSFDTDGMARPLMLKDAHENVVFPLLLDVFGALQELAERWKDIPMLAHTHGQPATPTTLGKEMKVFHLRLAEQWVEKLTNPYWSAKLGGASGNLNAHYVAYPGVDWDEFANKFVESLGLVRNPMTTQIEPYDHLAEYCQTWIRINNILIDFVRDMWMYIMMEYLKQKPKDGEVGSSTMPHKVNPIDFENAEGNLGLANAILDHLANKLPISRLQRDLSDSTVIRNMGVPLAHMMIAYNSIIKGIGKIDVNLEAINADLEKNWAVVAEAIQTILRREMYPDAYDVLKKLTRTGEKTTKASLHAFIDTLEVAEAVKNELKAITPWNYLGVLR